MAQVHPLNRTVPKVKGDKGPGVMTKAKGNLYWRVHTTDEVIPFTKLAPNRVMGDLGKLLKIYDSTFEPDIRGRNRDRLQIQSLITSWGNDAGRREGRGKLEWIPHKVATY
jgi:hypothetical protein